MNKSGINSLVRTFAQGESLTSARALKPWQPKVALTSATCRLSESFCSRKIMHLKWLALAAMCSGVYVHSWPSPSIKGVLYRKTHEREPTYNLALRNLQVEDIVCCIHYLALMRLGSFSSRHSINFTSSN